MTTYKTETNKKLVEPSNDREIYLRMMSEERKKLLLLYKRNDEISMKITKLRNKIEDSNNQGLFKSGFSGKVWFIINLFKNNRKKFDDLIKISDAIREEIKMSNNQLQQLTSKYLKTLDNEEIQKNSKLLRQSLEKNTEPEINRGKAKQLDDNHELNAILDLNQMMKLNGFSGLDDIDEMKELLNMKELDKTSEMTDSIDTASEYGKKALKPKLRTIQVRVVEKQLNKQGAILEDNKQVMSSKSSTVENQPLKPKLRTIKVNVINKMPSIQSPQLEKNKVSDFVR